MVKAVNPIGIIKNYEGERYKILFTKYYLVISNTRYNKEFKVHLDVTNHIRGKYIKFRYNNKIIARIKVNQPVKNDAILDIQEPEKCVHIYRKSAINKYALHYLLDTYEHYFGDKNG